jgi:hypothetical protein
MRGIISLMMILFVSLFVWFAGTFFIELGKCVREKNTPNPAAMLNAKIWHYKRDGLVDDEKYCLIHSGVFGEEDRMAKVKAFHEEEASAWYVGEYWINGQPAEVKYPSKYMCPLERYLSNMTYEEQYGSPTLSAYKYILEKVERSKP